MKSRLPRFCSLALALFVGSGAAGVAAAAEPAISEAERSFFEARIRPVLVEHCYECHSAKTASAKSNFRLDSRAALLRGGDNGTALVPARPAESPLIDALKYEGLEMPPSGKLPKDVIDDFVKWVEMGAPDPRVEDPAPAAGQPSIAAASDHWAFQPISPPSIPEVTATDWPQSPIDHFVLARLEADGLSPSPAADRRTLMRRVYYDLVGLPPTSEAVEAFVNDPRPDAWARLIDTLLASPHYGECWGRHWLDVARYADTKDGVLMYGPDRIRPYAYTYRDYVIQALNEGTPFDRFVHEQLAADQIEPAVEPWRLASMGFLTLGRDFDNNTHDVIDDRIDTVARGMIGLTVACARCHDHKYDPIPTADYYSLYGVFASSELPFELPLIGRPAESAGLKEFEEQIAPKVAALRQLLDEQYATLIEAARQRVPDYLVHVATTRPDPLETAIFFLSLQPTDLRPQMVARWRRLIEQRARTDDPVFGPWSELMGLADEEIAARSSALLAGWRERPAGTGPGELNPLVLSALAEQSLSGRADVARVYGELLRRVYDESKSAVGGDDQPAHAQLLALVVSPDSPAWFAKTQTWHYMSRGDKDRFGGMRNEIDKLAVQSAHAPPRAMVLRDTERLYDPRIFVRGSPSQPGEEVPRRFLEVLEGADRSAFTNGSGRLDLAKAITSAENPLTARVIVNRVWMHHFGAPLVENPDDFGLRTGPPSHPELLDDLAARLQRHGWSLKALHREILLSSTYRQASFDRPEARERDPENRLLWRMNRRRLDLEAMCDGLLAVSGRLDGSMGGRPVDVAEDPQCRRRTVYGLVDRQSLPGVFRAFDFASPDQSIGRRPETTVPQQALFGMNSPFIVEQAKSLAARTTVAGEQDPRQRIAELYRLVYCRAPDDAEIEAGVQFVSAGEATDSGEASQFGRWEQFAQILLLTNEFLFVD